ncbi:Hypothetical protein I5071_82650 [Sandaracinus amylolyticus]|nr:Hypothetical protein I5071_82650 [Sandaracinus amylolyticus]
MRVTQLRQADLNLLVVFAVLAEERSVSRTAARLFISQPAVSRALQRLRDTFDDDLLVRTPAGYETTPKGQRLAAELSLMLPRLDRLLSGERFDPMREEASFRIGATEQATHVLGPPLCREHLPLESQVSFELVPWHDGLFDALAHGSIDMLFYGDDGHVPDHLSREVLFDTQFVCVVDAKSRHRKRLTLAQYVAARHIGVGILGGRQTHLEQRLAAIGEHRRFAIRVPYIGAAIRSVVGTDLVATVPERMAREAAKSAAVRVVGAPRELGTMRYLMIWHPRVESDAAHTWLRETMRAVGRSLEN